MMKWIRSLFSTPTDDFGAMKLKVEQILQLDLSSDEARQEHEEVVVSVLRKLDVEIEHIRQQANGYPARPISSLVWMNGFGYGNLMSALTRHFRNASWLKHEENASAMWVKVALAVCSHYHHVVGPAMLANANCHELLGNTDRATQMYSAIVEDFSFIAEDWSNESGPPIEEDRSALESLQTASQRLLLNGVNEVGGINIMAIKKQAEVILSRPHTTSEEDH